MGLGFENALAEITLVIFTALAPSGAAAFIVMGLPLLVRGTDPACRERINRFMGIPILVALVGLVASATHLGTPGNALYVLSGIGRSPLSNEVFAGAIFFGIAGSYWFYSFSQLRRPSLERAWVVLAMLAAATFIVAIAFAYQVSTIVSWAHPSVPLNLVLNAFVGGPLLALVGFAAVGATAPAQGCGDCPHNRLVRACIVVAAVALVANVAGYIVQGFAVLPLANATVTATGLMPCYGLAVAAMAVFDGVGVAVDALALRKAPRPGLRPALIASLLAFAGIFVMRFTFYMLHMTVGISF